MADMNRRAWLIVAVVALAVPGSIYLGYELQRRNQICSAALAFREKAFQYYTAKNYPDIVKQLHDYCGIG